MDILTTTVELFGSAECPHTMALREHLLWNRIAFTEYNIDDDPAARARLLSLTGGRATVPVLVENGRVTAIGWRGRSCAVES